MLMNVKGYTENELLEYESVRKWLGNLADTTKVTNLYTIKYFMNWIGQDGGKFSRFTPDELIEYQQNTSSHKEQYEILDDLLIKWVEALREKNSTGYVTRNYATIRGFFKRNRAELPSDPDVNTRGEKETTTPDLSIFEVKEIIGNCDIKYKAVFLLMLQGGMDSAAFVYWNSHGYNSLLEQLSDLPQNKADWVIRIDQPGRKRRRNVEPFHTYIGSDAIEAIQTYLKTRPENMKELAIFYNDYDNPLNGPNIQTYWRRLLKRRGFIDAPENPSDPGNRYGKPLHELRDVFRTQFRKSTNQPDQTVPEFMMGHGVDKNQYDKATKDEVWARGEYLKGVGMVQIMTSGEPFGQVPKKDIQDAENRLNARIKELESEKNDKIDELEQKLAYVINLVEKKAESEKDSN